MTSARLIPIALTLMRTSLGPGAGTWTSTNSRTSGPPGFANLIVRDMAVSVKPTLPGFRIVARPGSCLWAPSATANRAPCGARGARNRQLTAPEYVALPYDHRIVDGREAVTFLVRLKEC